MFALTSHSENFGIAVLEAMANGLPVLIAPGVALAPLVERSRLGWITPLDQADITATLHHLFNHPELLQQVGERAQTIVRQQYTWNHIATSLIKQYQSIVQIKALAFSNQPS